MTKITDWYGANATGKQPSSDTPSDTESKRKSNCWYDPLCPVYILVCTGWVVDSLNSIQYWVFPLDAW